MKTIGQTNTKTGSQTPLNYLAIGDSYTIGQAVPIQESFPYQAVQRLRQQGWNIGAPEIVATTGWTTDELAAAIQSHRFLPQYDLVSLLIGVNNQYRGKPLETYKEEFAALLQQAIHFTGGNKQNVVVLSIPDWGVTSFAHDRNREQIRREIDAFNAAAEAICRQNKVHFINITEGSRAAKNDASLVAADGLHPSGKEYAKWAEAVADVFSKVLMEK